MQATEAKPSFGVIGSGPGAFIAARTLAEAGTAVTVIDPCMTLPAAAEMLAAKLASTPQDAWPSDLVTRARANPSARSGKVPKKYAFGSDYLYSESVPGSISLSSDRIAAAPSFAKGGFMGGWGGAVLPLAVDDRSDWPCSMEELDAAFSEVARRLPIAGRRDQLSEIFPFDENISTEAFALNQGMRRTLDALKRIKTTKDMRIVAGQSRLAVYGSNAGRWGCRHCGMCISGCPFGSIYKLDLELDRLAERPNVTMASGEYVLELKENVSGVTVTSRLLGGGGVRTRIFDRVFLGAGAINTARLMLQSEGRFGSGVRIRDSQKFVVPLLSRFASCSREQSQELPAIFIEMKLPDVSPHWAHFQISKASSLALDSAGIPNFLRPLLRPLIDRTAIAWAGLHSELSHGFDAVLTGYRDASVMKLTEVENPLTRPTLRRYAREVGRAALGSGLLFSPLAIEAAIGGGFHFGASFPIVRAPARFGESDPAGRPFGWQRLHIVDSSSLPSIPATTVALTIMSNAYRISSQFQGNDR